MFFWALNVLVIVNGIDSIRILLNIKAPPLIGAGLLLLGWAYRQERMVLVRCSASRQLSMPDNPRQASFSLSFVPALTGMVGFWATLSLNIPDFSRYAKSQRDQIIGQTLGLPTTMGNALLVLIGVAVTSATIVIFGHDIWDPVVVLTNVKSPIALIVAMVALCVATLATNIAANVVSPANDFLAHLSPRLITFPHRRTNHRRHRHRDHAMEADRQFAWLYLHLARGLFGTAWSGRRDSGLRLLGPAPWPASAPPPRERSI